jgi:hypothetical protein
MILTYYRAGEKTYPYMDEKESYRRYGPDPTRPATAGDRRKRKSHLALNVKKAGDDWGKSFVPESPPPKSNPNFGDILHTGSNVKLQRNSIQLQQRKPPAKISRTESSPDVRTKLLPMSLLTIPTLSKITTIADLPELDMEAYHQQSSRVHFRRQSQSSSQHLRMSCMKTTNHTLGMESARSKTHLSCLSHRFRHLPPLTQIF